MKLWSEVDASPNSVPSPGGGYPRITGTQEGAGNANRCSAYHIVTSRWVGSASPAVLFRQDAAAGVAGTPVGVLAVTGDAVPGVAGTGVAAPQGCAMS